jgi:hypothetical protein
MHTGRRKEARKDYAKALKIAQGQSGSTYTQTLSLLMRKAIECLEKAAPGKREEELGLNLLKAKLQKKDYKGLLDNLPAALEICR